MDRWWPRAWLPDDPRRWVVAVVGSVAFLLIGVGVTQAWSRVFAEQERADAEEQRADAACDTLTSYNLPCPEPIPSPVNGVDGEDGRDGRDATQAMVDASVAAYMATHEVVDIEELIREVARDVAGSALLADMITDAVDAEFDSRDLRGPAGPVGPSGAPGPGPSEEQVIDGVRAFYALVPCAWAGEDAVPAFVTLVTTGGPQDAWVCVPAPQA